MNNVTKLVNFVEKNGPLYPFVWIVLQELYLYTNIFKNISIVQFENLQGNNPMGLCAPWADYKRNYFTNIKMSPTFL